MMQDEAGAVRSEDHLNVENLKNYLTSNIVDLVGELTLKQFKGGASNMTYHLVFENREFILRCPPTGTKSKGAHDMYREFNILKSLKPFYPSVPEVYLYCNDVDIIGKDFFIMEKLSGIIPRSEFPEDLKLSKDQIQILCRNVVDKMIELHQIDIEKTPLKELSKGSGYIQRQIEGWIYRYKKAKTWNVPSCNKVMTWLQTNIPDNEKQCFIHNDFRLDNLVFDLEDPVKIKGVLDWELATIGDPLMDLGNSLAYWVQADDDFIMRSIRRQPTHVPGMMSRKEVVEYYALKTGQEIKNFDFYEVYGLFRLAVIVQQIYYRYHHRQTSNPAFKKLWMMVQYLNWRCKKIISR